MLADGGLALLRLDTRECDRFMVDAHFKRKDSISE